MHLASACCRLSNRSLKLPGLRRLTLPLKTPAAAQPIAHRTGVDRGNANTVDEQKPIAHAVQFVLALELGRALFFEKNDCLIELNTVI